MTVNELKDKISDIMNCPISSQVYPVLKENDAFVVKLADIEDDIAAPEIQNMFSEYIRNNIIGNEDLQICELSTADERLNAIYHYDYAEYPDELDVFHNFDIKNYVQNAIKFNFEEDDLNKLFGFIIYLGDMEKGITLFKKHYPISLIKRSSFLLGAIKSKERFEVVSGNDIVRLNATVQLLKIENELYATELAVLERNMGFNRLIQRAAREVVQAIDAIGILEDIQVLIDSTEEAGFSRRLSKVKKSSPIFKLHIDKETIVQFTKRIPELSGKFKYSEDGTMIRLDTKKSKESFIKLMNDSFLRSELTKQFYETTVKDNITAES